ncbi:hypothetical protein HYPSUDRAFT_144499 [Hypholoma sublateritium FD-334 SS-4]|uniref:AMP-dependent synthetase/ligase domain-containing protein n=1 Tax=Hypholoma sublateritium (strain FD-334 SS-4) TaxID=945553 RepID=A0A0D2KVV3_HYPSF|nr:hypothetical protein HYPSUDRAFT_144499 [Hypholoma sublateritium FD-334 SS-4]
MAPRIYTSPLPRPPLAHRSVFTHLFASRAAAGTGSADGNDSDVGGYPGAAPAFIDAATGTVLTRGQLKRLALAFAYGLRTHPATRAHAGRGKTVMVYAPNGLAWPVVVFGSVAAGLRCTLANHSYTARELAFQYADSGAALVFTSEAGVGAVRAALKSQGFGAADADARIVVLRAGLEWAGGPAAPRAADSAALLSAADILGRGELEEEERFDGPAMAGETVYLCYSSGTTGKPKGVETTHTNITSVLGMISSVVPMDAQKDIMLGFLPLYHIYGAVKLLHWPFTLGVPVALMTHFDPENFCAYAQRYKATISLVVPPVLVVLARHPAVDKYDLSSFNILMSGAAPLGAELTNTVIDRLQLKGDRKEPLKILQGYGLTETSPTTHLVPPANGADKIGSIGVQLPHLEIRLVVDGDGDGLVDAAAGERGELWVRGPTIMKGYLNNPTATRDAITPDGWFKTGDIGTRDADGFYYIVDRRKELIKYKGFQVPPAELEGLLLTHPDIADAAVIGVESAKEATELPRAYVAHANPASLRSQSDKIAFAESVRSWVQSKVARHKYLRGGVVVIAVIPKSAAGKILRRELRERSKGELAGRDPADDIVRTKL